MIVQDRLRALCALREATHGRRPLRRDRAYHGPYPPFAGARIEAVRERRRWARLDDYVRNRLLDRRQASDDGHQARPRRSASSPGARWTRDDDVFLLEHSGLAACAAEGSPSR
jgi:hypothetical protein